MQEAVESAQEKLSTKKLNETTTARLLDKVARQRPVAGLGARQDDRRLYLALPGSGSVDAKLDVPTVAVIGGRLLPVVRCWLASAGRRGGGCPRCGPCLLACRLSRETAAPGPLPVRTECCFALPCADGANATIAVEAPSFNKGEGVQRVRLTFPAFSELIYDPVR